jgi:uncharacterized protein Yka (UPF0111/DUF47 family)
MAEDPINRRHGDAALIQHQLKEEKRLLEIEQNIKSLEEKIDTLSKDVSDLVSAWKAASWLVSLVKWVGGIAVAVTAIVTLLKGVK